MRQIKKILTLLALWALIIFVYFYYNNSHSVSPALSIPYGEIKGKIALVTGAAGFIGSHLTDRLLKEGYYVIGIDNFITGNMVNLEDALSNKNFKFILHDVSDYIALKVDEIYHLASPASPNMFTLKPIETWKANTVGTLNLLHPLEHPQTEMYSGNVNPIGVRAVYDESKRSGEALVSAFKRENRVETRIARIFNTFGPRMHPRDGRVISTFISQLLKNESLEIYSSGVQTRSFIYVDDLVNGLVALMSSKYHLPVNLGNPHEEISISDLAFRLRNLMPNNRFSIQNKPERPDDPKRRRPDINRARNEIGWEPEIPLDVGLKNMIDYMKTLK